MSGHRGSQRRYEIVPTRPEHLYELARTLRGEDLAEVTGSGSNPKHSLWRGYRYSVLCRAAIVDGEVAAVWGLCVTGDPGLSLLSDTGRPWLLTSPAVERIPFALVKGARHAVAEMLMLKPRLENYVLASYTKAVRMLELIGFSVDRPEPIGLSGMPYCRFHMVRAMAVAHG